jgi:hypothetical protein
MASVEDTQLAPDQSLSVRVTRATTADYQALLESEELDRIAIRGDHIFVAGKRTAELHPASRDEEMVGSSQRHNSHVDDELRFQLIELDRSAIE